MEILKLIPFSILILGLNLLVPGLVQAEYPLKGTSCGSSKWLTGLDQGPGGFGTNPSALKYAAKYCVTQSNNSKGELSAHCRRLIKRDDLGLLKVYVFQGNLNADINGDGVANEVDRQIGKLAVLAQEEGGTAIFDGRDYAYRIFIIAHNLGYTFTYTMTDTEAYQDAFGAIPSEPEARTFASQNPCFCYENLAGTSQGKANIFKKGPFDLSTNAFREPAQGTSFQYLRPEPACLNQLGTYHSETGVRLGNNNGYLSGLYAETDMAEFSPPTGRLNDVHNDFRIGYPALDEQLSRNDMSYLIQTHAYYFYTDFRNSILNPTMISQLRLPLELEKNLKYRQFRIDMPPAPPGSTLRLAKPILRAFEQSSPFFNLIYSFENVFLSPFVSQNYYQFKPYSSFFSPDTAIGDVLGLTAQWILGVNQTFPADAFFTSNWSTNVLTAINDGTWDWGSYRYLSKIHGSETSRMVTEHTRQSFLSNRFEAGYPCGSSAAASKPYCDAGENINNVMTMDEVRGTGVAASWFFPFKGAGYASPYAEYTESDLGGTFIASIFYDIAQRGGIGAARADLLFWKALSLINRTDKMPMRRYGQIIQEAARALWADPQNPSQSIYEEMLRHTLLMKGIAVDATFFCADVPDIYGAADTYTCCPFVGSPDPSCPTAKVLTGTAAATASSMFPPAVGFNQGSLFEAATTLFLSGSLPEVHPAPNGFGQVTAGRNGYTHPTGQSSYVAYTFLKDSKYGPFDKFIVTNDFRSTTFTNMSAATWTCADSLANGYLCREFSGDELSNKTILFPGNRIRYARQMRRGTSMRDATYVEDTAPIGTRAIKALTDGFAFTVVKTGETSTSISYTLSSEDPSYNSATDSYSWNIGFFRNSTTTTGAIKSFVGPTAGASISLNLHKNQPVIIELTRIRNGTPEVLRIVDRANDLDRDGGNQFSKRLF